ncbi:MAG: DUF2817 domain-containing protein [Betaproteobacteria bacterium]|nr:MAG: DUF2817 domain-containing protein [Betaproteobacteria bacterium]
MSARHFAQSYPEARAKFAAAASAEGLVLERHVHPGARGAEGEELSLDCARLGPARAADLLVLTSATHGVEGFCGSGAQVALLHDADFLARARSSGTAVLFVHAVNPYGFSHWGRTNEDNIDLNRNFIDHAAPRPANDAYAEVHPLLVAEEWPPAAEREAAIGRYIAERGQFAFQAAVSGGQYAYPDGLFFGGHAPSWSNLTLRQVLRAHGAGARRLLWIDFHTGLGAYGHGELIHAGRDDDAELARATTVWGGELKSIYKGTSVSARLEGLLAFAAYEEVPQAELTGCALEFGTLPVMQVLQALRAENWLRRHAQAAPGERAALRRQVRDAFYCDAGDWKERVVAQGREVALQALAAPRWRV